MMAPHRSMGGSDVMGSLTNQSWKLYTLWNIVACKTRKGYHGEIEVINLTCP